MNRLSSPMATCVAALILFFSAVSPAAAQDSTTVGNYQLVPQRPSTVNAPVSVYRATLTNHCGAIQSATAELTSSSPNTVVVQGSLKFGAIAAGGSRVSTDTFVIRHDPAVPLNPDDLVWSVVVSPPRDCGTLRVRPLSDIRAGDAFSVVVEVVDGAGNIDTTFSGTVNVNAAAAGGSNFNGGQKSATAIGGVATINGLALNNAADGYMVTASALGVFSGVSNSFNATFRTLAVAPVANVRSGDPLTVQVDARDANGQLAENFGAASSLSLANLQSAVPANGQTAFDAAVAPMFLAGSATFTGMSISNAADGYTFSALATSAGTLVTDALDAAFNVTASTLAISALPDRVAGVSFNATVTAKDNAGLNAENFFGTIDLNAAATGGSNFVGGTRTAAAASGSASFFGLALNNAADGYLVTATAAGLLNGVSNGFNVTFSTLTVLAVANVRSGDPFDVQVEARDANGALAENFGSGNSLSLTNLQAAVIANGQTAFDAAVAPMFGAGSATFSGMRISNAADGYRFSAQATSAGTLVSDALDAGFNVTASTLGFSAIPDRVAGFSFDVTVTAKDNAGLNAENFTGSISVNAAATGGSNFVGGTKTTASVSGAAAFVGLVLNNAADGYLVTASAGPLNGVSNSFNVTFSTLMVVPVANVRSGDPFDVQVEARDANGALAENFGSGSSLSLTNLQAAVIANGQTAFDAAVAPMFGAGSATFTGMRISNAADGYRFSAQATSAGTLVTDALDSPFNVTASTFGFSALLNQVAGASFNVTVTAKDNAGFTAENFLGSINLNAAAAGGSNFVGGTKTTAAAFGAASFVGLQLNNAADGYTMTASAAGASGISSSFDVTFSMLSVVPVANVRSGAPFDVQVEARDANGALAENFDSGSGLSLINLHAAVLASGQTAFDAAVAPMFGAGSATFTGMRISNAADGYTFSAQATSSGILVSDALNAPFNVTASTFVFSALPDRVSGALFNVTVTAKDTLGLDAENFFGTINLDAAAAGGSNFVGGTKSAAAGLGAATFIGLQLNNAANGYRVTASEAGGVSVNSSAFNVVYATLTVAPVANARSADPFSVQVDARDAGGNLAENFGTTLSNGSDLSLENLVATLAGSGQTAFNAPVPAPAFGAGTGSATFTGLRISNAADGYRFNATATRAGGTVDSPNSNLFNVTAKTFVFSALPDRVSGALFNVTVTAKDDAGLDAENFSGAISLSAVVPAGGSNFVAGSPSALPGPSATFLGLQLNNAANGYKVMASEGGGISVNSSAFNVTYATLTVAPVANVQAGSPFNVQIEARDAGGNLAENFGATLSNGNDLSLENLVATVAGSGQTAFNAPVSAPAFGAGTGIATFTGLSISNAADGYRFNATATRAGGTVDSPASNLFNVTAKTFVFSALPDRVSGALFNITVTAKDDAGLDAENFTGGITLSAVVPAGGSNFVVPPPSPLPGPSATFLGLQLNNAANAYKVMASDAASISVNSSAFNVVYATLTVAPVANVPAGSPFNVQIEARDGGGSLAENFGTTLSNGNDLSLENLVATVAGSGQTAFNAPVSAPAFGAGSGIATFTGLTISNAADGYRFNATATRAGGTVDSPASNLFNVTAKTFVFSALPDRVSGALFNVTVTAKDDAGLDAENFSGAITLSAVVPAGGSNFVAGSPAALPGPSATFLGLQLNNAANAYKVNASAGPLTVDSSAFNIVYATLTVAPVANVQAGSPFNVQIEARDGGGSLAENFGTTLSNGNDLSLENLVATVPGDGQTAFDVPVPAPTFGGGTATFTGLRISDAADGYRFNATATRAGGTVDSPTSNLFNVTATTAQSMELQLSQFVVGAEGAITVKATVRNTSDGAIVPAPEITYQILSDGGSSGAPPAVTPVGPGQAQILAFVDTRGGYRLRATLNETTVTSDVIFAVIQNAAQSTNAGKFVALSAAQGTAAASMDAIADALDAGNLETIDALYAAMQNARESVIVTGRNAIQRGRAVAPDVGFLPDAADLIESYPETADDAAFGSLIDQIAGKIGKVTAFYDDVNPSTPSAAGLDRLNNELQALQTQLLALNITPHAIVNHTARVNNLLRDTIPLNLRAVTGKIGAGLLRSSSRELDLVNSINGAVMAQVSRMMVILAADSLLTDYRNFDVGGIDPENVAENEVFVIGGDALQPAEGLIEAFNPSAILSFDDIDAYFDGIIDVLEKVPSSSGSNTPVIVLYHDKDTGHWSTKRKQN